ncbi:hypothetical protein Scep_025163 [Stephania cephalantha]|uniref:RING-CH-type domain-containing protein n=1 Tax=Stephania cephalantha TaxID=152367 RepID=A0AAP0EI39_9MAGN
MQNYGSDVLNGGGTAVSEHCVDASEIDKLEKGENLQVEKGGIGVGGGGGQSSGVNEGGLGVVTVIISNEVSVIPEPGSAVLSTEPSLNSVPVVPEPKGSTVKKDERADDFSSPKKGSLSRSESAHEQCRVCQQQMEEPLIDLGCQCRGGLAKAHRSCIDTWFRTRGSNRCEICQQVATNVSPPESQQSRNYWVWRIDPTVRRPGIVLERERGCYGPLWVAFSILIGGLLLDVLISISLGVSALPVNIIIGVLVVLGLGTALRLALECCHELTIRRAVTQRIDTTITLTPLGYHPAV